VSALPRSVAWKLALGWARHRLLVAGVTSGGQALDNLKVLPEATERECENPVTVLSFMVHWLSLAHFLCF